MSVATDAIVVPVSKRETLLEHLAAAGEHGLTSVELVERVGHRFGARLDELRHEGHDIRREPVPGTRGALHRYTLILPEGTPPPPAGLVPGELLSVRRAWPVLARLLADDSPSSRAQVAALLLRQRGLASQPSIRHNLGRRKRALLDEIAAELGLAEPGLPC